MRRWYWLSLCAATLAVGIASATAFGDDWAQFRGPDRNGISKETKLLKQWPEGGPTLLWTATGLGKGYSSAAIAAGTIYVSGNIGDQFQVMALGLDGKTVKWKQVIGGGGGDAGQHPGSRGTPTVDGDSVYCESPAGDIACMDTKTGTIKWKNNIRETFQGRPGSWAYAESVLIDGNNVICTPGGPNATLAALNKKTGATVWTSQGLSDGAGYASPILFTMGKLRTICTFSARGVVAVNADNGKFLWRYDRPANRVANISSPVFYKDMVFCASSYKTGGGLVNIANTPEGATATQAWETADFTNQHGGYVIVNDHIYGHSDAQGWMCMDIKDGHAAWQSKALGKGSVIEADGMLYCLTEGWQMALVKADPAGFGIVSQFAVPRTGGGEKSWAHPSIANGKLYLRDDDHLLCYDIKGK